MDEIYCPLKAEIFKRITMEPFLLKKEKKNDNNEI